MHLRNYNDKDFPNLIKLLEDSGLYYEPLDKRRILKRKIDYDSQSIIIAEEGHKVIGTVFTIYDPWNAFIYHLGVLPEHRKKGLGTILMNEAERRLKSRGINRPTIFVEEKNKGVLKFYKKRGWFSLYKVYCLEKNL